MNSRYYLSSMSSFSSNPLDRDNNNVYRRAEVDEDLASQCSSLQLSPRVSSSFGNQTRAPVPASNTFFPPLEGKDLMYALIISQLVSDGHLDMATSLAQSKNLSAFRFVPAQHLQAIVDSYRNVIRTEDCNTNPVMQSLNPSVINFYYESGNVRNNVTPRTNTPMAVQQGGERPVPKRMIEIRLVSKFGTLGSGPTELNMPHGFCTGLNDEIVVADTNNHRISIFSLQGKYRFSFGEEGIADGKLYQPRKIALLHPTPDHPEPVFVVCDRGSKRSRMQIFTKDGKFVRVIDIPYIDIVSGLTTTRDGKIVIVDSVKSTVSVLQRDGTALNWFVCGSIAEPSDVAVHLNEFYICDFKGNSVQVFNEHGKLERTIGLGYSKFPNGIDISDNGDVLVGDSHGNRFHVTLFTPQGRYIADYECPTLKVSRCCGLKCTKDGYIVTLAKNNNQALVLTPLYY